MKDGSTDELSRGEAIHAIDEYLCKAFDEPIHPIHWFRGWVDNIGMFLACGKTWNECREIWKEIPDQLEVIDWMEEHTMADGHYER